MKKEKSCGICVFKEENNQLFVLLVHHNLGHWGPPKGHMELGETEQETALREVFEETGIEANIIDGFREVITYSPKEDAIKDVVFFIGNAVKNNVTPQITEVSEAVWINVNDVDKYVAHLDQLELLRNAIFYYQSGVRK